MNPFTPGIHGSVSAYAEKIVRACGVTTAILLLALPLFSQQNLGRIYGGVTDQMGALVSGAAVTVTNDATGTVRNLTTDQAGQYNAPALIPGTYTVRVTATGFKVAVSQGILLETGKESLVDFKLTPGTISQSVVVSAAPPLINTTSATLGGTLSTAQINDMPLIGRNYVNLVTLRPGAAQAPGGGGWTLSTDGLRVDAQGWIVDGVNNKEPYLAQQVINSQSPAGDAATILPIDAISQFNVMENPKAEYGYAAGAIVNVGIKSGTNTLHGTGYAFGRSGSWDARNFFNNGQQNPLSLEQWGGTVGGPIVKDKVFYFAGFERQSYSLGVPLPVVLPTNLTGDPSVSVPAAEAALAGHGVPLNQLSLNLLPLWGTSPNASGNVTLNNLTDSNYTNNVLGKVDYTINSHNSVSGFYFFGNDNSVAEDFPVVRPQFLSKIHQRGQTATGSWTWVPNARTVNALRFGYIRWNQPIGTVDENTPATAFGINTGVTNPQAGGMPLIFVKGLGGGAALSSGLGSNIDWRNYYGPDSNFDFLDNVSYLRGKHTFMWGGELLSTYMDESPNAYAKGNINFLGGGAFPGSTGLEDYLAGAPTFGLLSTGNQQRHYHSFYYAGFVQDDWRVTPNLTLNLGLRYEYWSPLKERDNLMGSWSPTAGFFSAGGSEGSTVYTTSTKSFAPRFGFAWDMFGNGKTVLRGGGGLYNDAIPGSAFLFNLVNLQNAPTSGIGQDPSGAYFVNSAGVAAQLNPNGNTAGTVFYPFLNWNTAGPVFPIHPVACGNGVTTITSGPASLIGIPPVPCNVFAVNQHLLTPYVADWTLGLEQAITTNLSFEVTYVGNHGTNLTSLTDANQINPAAPGEIACNHCEANTDRPYGTRYPDIAIVNMMGNAYRSNYDSLATTLTARAFHRMSFIFGYTFAHGLDDTSFGHFPVTPQNSLDPSAEYGSSDVDVRHRTTLTWTYNLPDVHSPAQLLQGWMINSIVLLQSAMPWAAYDTGDDISKTGELMDRWDFFGNPSTFSGHGYTPIPYFSGTSNPACQAAAASIPNGPGGTTGLQSLSQYGCFAEGNNVLVPPAIGSFGFAGRNIFRDSGFYNWNFSIFKQFRFKERITAQFRAEFFNVLNHPAFANPYGSITAWGPHFSSDPSAPANFGCGCRTPDVAQTDPVLGSGGPRAIQLGLKIIY